MTTDPKAAILCRAIAGEMRQMANLVGHLAAVLIADEEVAMRHIDEMQKFDLIVQMADETASLLDRMASGVDSSDAVGVVRLEAIQQRLEAAITMAA